jgi:futalosine hydrolase
MAFRILIVTSSALEAAALKDVSTENLEGKDYPGDIPRVDMLVTGVGSMATAWSLKRWIDTNGKPDLAINAGIAGSFRDDVETGSVVMPVTDCFADLGIEDHEQFFTLWEAGLADPDGFPYSKGYLHASNRYVEKAAVGIRPVNGITVNTASGSAATIQKLIMKFNPDIETMESAAFFYLCIAESIPFMSVRAISNRVEPRNRSNWRIQHALENLVSKMNWVLENVIVQAGSAGPG